MTLFIACLLIYGFELSNAWYAFASVLWILHLLWGVAKVET